MIFMMISEKTRLPRFARNDDTKKPQTTPQQTTTVLEYPSRILKVICGIQQILCPLDFAALSVKPLASSPTE